jgi:acyl carrier protein
MITRENIVPRVLTILSEVTGCKVSEISEKDDIANDLGADSLDYTEIGMNCEDEFEVELICEDVQEAVTVGELIDMIVAAQPGIQPQASEAL